jgi:hypothetical protein
MKTKKKRNLEKKKIGRPKENVEEKVDFGIVKRYAAIGFTTNEELAYLLGVSVKTITRYKTQSPEFLSILQNACFKPDSEVVESLLMRAKGFERIVEKPMVISDGKNNGSHVEIIKYTEYYPPDTLAINSWNNNRRRHQWAWSPKPTSGLDDEQTELLRKLSESAMHEAL